MILSCPEGDSDGVLEDGYIHLQAKILPKALVFQKKIMLREIFNDWEKKVLYDGLEYTLCIHFLSWLVLRDYFIYAVAALNCSSNLLELPMHSCLPTTPKKA